MRKRTQKTVSIILALAFMVVLAAPAGAGEVLALQVNGEEVSGADLMLQEGISMVPVDIFASVAGSEAEAFADQVMVIDGKSYLPLRSVAESLGYQVNWTPGLVSLEKETVAEEGLTAMDVLIKSNQVTQEVNTYSMKGIVNQVMVMEVDGESLPIETTTEMYAQYQMEPLQMYIKQKSEFPMDVDAMEEMGEEADEQLLPESMEIETFMDEEYMYMTMTGQEGWIKQPHFLPIEVIKEQQQITSNPLQAAEQMLEMGVDPQFGEDAIIDGREHYVIIANMDMEKVLGSQKELLQQVVSGVGQMTDGESEADQEMMSTIYQMVMKQMIEDGVFDYQYSMYVDKETFLPGLIKFDITINMELDFARMVENISEVLEEEVSEEELAELAGVFMMDIKQTGEMEMFDFGKEFVKPDLSEIIEMDAMPVPEEVPEE